MTDMKIIIVGCGRVGEALAEQLNEEGDDIVVVDQNAAKVRDVATKYDLLGIIGNGATHSVQEEAGIGSADLLIAVTGSDELNLLCCIMAKKAAGCQVIARVKSPEYAQDISYLKSELGLAMVINPEYMAAKEIARVLHFPAAMKIDTFGRGRIELIKFRLPEGSPIAGLSVRDAMIKLKANVLICTVERGDEAYIPKGDFVFAERDVISIIAAPRAAIEFFEKINYKNEAAKNVIIIGATAMTHYLCDELVHSGVKVKLIDNDELLCNEFAMKYDDVTVICGEPTDEDLLSEEGISRADAFVSLATIDEENIMLSLYAKQQGVKKTVTKINRTEYTDVIKQLDLDSVIHPRNITADLIARYVRATKNTEGSNMETLYNVIKGKIEASEFVVGKSSLIVGKPLSDLEFKENVLIAAILRAGQLIIPRGNVIIKPGDSVVIVTGELGIHDISDILKK
ncbi:MAG: Trk system potassium transporter TrkA [Clostridia bacterium]|nr:Trk system potassium transporter TrkA [Clostridia bacterium]